MSVEIAEPSPGERSGPDPVFADLAWSFRTALGLRVSPWWLATGIWLAMTALCVVWGNVAGFFQGVYMEGVPFWLHPAGSSNLVYIGIPGLMSLALAYLVRGIERDLAQLASYFAGESPSPDEARREVLVVPRRTLRLYDLAGLAVAAFAITGLMLSDSARDLSPLTWGWIVFRELLVDILFVRLLGFGLILSTNLSRMLARREHFELLDREPLEIAARGTVRTTLLWLVGWGVSLPFLFIVPLQGASLGILVTSMVGSLVVVVPAILLPVRSLVRRIGAEKDDELTCVRAEIIEARRVRDDARLPGLIAWEERVAAISEWPLDASAFGRLGLYLLIPIASWVGSALMERMVDLTLD